MTTPVRAVTRTRLTHRCGHFLGEVMHNTVFVLCARCKALVALVVPQQPECKPSQPVLHQQIVL